MATAESVPLLGRDRITLVDGRTFAVSDAAGDMSAPTHGLVHDDLRHVMTMRLEVVGARIEVLASDSPTPLSAVVVARVVDLADPGVRAVLTRRRWVAGGLREDVHLHNTTKRAQTWELDVVLATDFAHVFDVKAGRCGASCAAAATDSGLRIVAADGATATEVTADPAPTATDASAGRLRWRLVVAPRAEVVVKLTIEPRPDGRDGSLLFPLGTEPVDAVPMQRLEAWRAHVPTFRSSDPRLQIVAEQALADIAALRILDVEHPDRAVVAAGAPWFMTVFGRDSLLTAWMLLPFEPSLAAGVLATLADLRGTSYDPVSEEQPGKILHELRRHGGGGPFSTRSRYYGTVDATPLFVMLAAEARRWDAIDASDLAALAPALRAAVAWILGDGDADGDGFVDYLRSDPSGLQNQGWKDSHDGVNYADGRFPEGRIALAEVQGYAYAALVGAAELSTDVDVGRPAAELRRAAAELRDSFNARFWDERGWFAVALDGSGRRVDALTTNPGHAVWAGIAAPGLADRYLDQLMGPAMWTGWGFRTLAETMDAYDPLSYHNGSVWPHDSAICAAGAARVGRWDVVDRVFSGALDAALRFDGRPPELFAGISRDEAPMPVAYPSSCSPQAWSSASILLLVRSLVGLEPDPDGPGVVMRRPDVDRLPRTSLDRLRRGDSAFALTFGG